MAEQTSNKPSTALSAGIATAKDLFALLRDSTLFIAALLLLVFPATFNAILTNAGFEEGSFAGLKWKRQFYDTDTALRTAQDTITSLQAQNADLLKALKEQPTAVASVQQREDLAKLEQANEAAAEAAKQVQDSVGATLASNAPLVEKARSVLATDTPPSVGYCYQEDKRVPGTQQYSVHCHTTLERCQTARGPNPRTTQSACVEVNLAGAPWKPRHPGWMGSWFEFRSEPFGAPFPQLSG
ncbi:MAG: hypothetical protein ACK2UO_13685 [Caldilineaceae bacterium]|jgi:hypothetical protein